MLVSDEEAAKIKKRLKEDCCVLPGGWDEFDDQTDVYCEEAEGYIEALLATREAVIAKLEEMKPGTDYPAYKALVVILDLIRNPKEAIPTPQPNPKARNSPGHTHTERWGKEKDEESKDQPPERAKE